MSRPIALLVLLVPVAELFLLLFAGRHLGGGPVLAWLGVTALVGYGLVRFGRQRLASTSMLDRIMGSLGAAPASGNVALGVVEGLDFAAAEMSIAPGDTLVVYTDGVTEAMDAGNRTFGVERLREALVTDVGSTAAEVAQSITDAVHRFAATAPQSDDLTLLCLRREP